MRLDVPRPIVALCPESNENIVPSRGPVLTNKYASNGLGLVAVCSAEDVFALFMICSRKFKLLNRTAACL
jgi:hypothetical protein